MPYVILSGVVVPKADLDAAIDAARPVISDLAKRIHERPELRYEEHEAVRMISETVEEHARVDVTRGVGGVETALRARIGEGGPRIAILAEYDALPEIGHACGHNLIAAGAVGAFLGLAKLREQLGGTIELIGTPAEEGGGGKIRLIEADVFKGVDAAIMYHPFDRDLLTHPTLASLWLKMSFAGVPSHAAVAPWEGKSALTACMDTFRLVDSQRVHFRDGVRVHGFVIDGGQAVNIIPEKASCEFSVRARSSRELARVRAIVERCARAAAMASDVQVEIELREGYKEMWNNRAIAERFGTALRDLGRSPKFEDPTVGTGSTDMGDVSHVVPSIHGWLAICDEGETMCHEHAFAACARSDRGLDTMTVAAKALARTAFELVAEPALLGAAKAEFETTKATA